MAMSMLRKITILALLAGAYGVAGAQTLDMEGASGSQSSERPTRGMTAERVEERFGMPEARVAPVGDPPIMRWEYANFVVFFEYDRVIHAVAKR